MLSRRNPLHYSHPSRAGVAESKQPILAQSYAKLGRENPTEEEQERGERERERASKEDKDRRKGCTYCIGHDAIVVVPSAPLSYARSERDYLARRERANIGSYSSRLYGAYVPTGFLRAFPPTYSCPSPLCRRHSSPLVAPCRHPSRGYLHHSCLLLVFLAPREIRRFCRSGSTLARRRDLSPGRLGRS